VAVERGGRASLVGWSPRGICVLADHLCRAEGTWQPFDRSGGWKAMAFGTANCA
jgi:hypothetical protein